MKVLYEILVPTIYGDTLKPIRTRHHKEWDKYVMKITGGMTILTPGHGKWLHEGVEYPEKVIPVRVMVEESTYERWLAGERQFDHSQIDTIIQFTLSHYRQKAVMYYLISNQVQVVFAKA
jgi:hypothetical protein